MNSSSSEISRTFLGAKGYSEKEIKEYYKRLKDVRHALNKSAPDRLATEHLFDLEGGLRFFYQEWPHVQKKEKGVPKMIVFVFHEAYGCSDLYYTLADVLNPLGAMVVGLDYRGHGRTGGQAGGNLGDLQSFQDIYQDVVKLVETYAEIYQVPMFFFGFDLGGLIAMNVLARFSEKILLNIEGIILVSPIWRLKSALKHAFLRPVVSIGRFFSKGNPVQKVTPEILKPTYYPEYQEYTAKNPFRLQSMSLRFFNLTLNLIQSSHRILRKMKIPCLVFQGTDDATVDHFAVHKMFEKWPHPNKKIRLYEQRGHNLLMDKFTTELYQDTITFLNLNLE
jgi:alpha-beta hydrolase superfamily lysophospholipase